MPATVDELEEALNMKFLNVKRSVYKDGFHTFHIDFPNLNWGFYLVVYFEGSEIWLYSDGGRDRDQGSEPDETTKYNGTIKHCFEIIEKEILSPRRKEIIFERKVERLHSQYNSRYDEPVPEDEMEAWLDDMGGHLDGQRTWR